MLSVRVRQTYLKELGFYTGAIDGIAGRKTRAAYKALQDAYFTRAADKDGIYGVNTEKLLINAYRVATTTKNFKLEEFRCKCGTCTGFPSLLDINLLKNLQLVRDKFGATTITSGLRCVKHNKAVGGVSNSRHLVGKAADIKGGYTQTKPQRQEVMDYWKSLPKYRYTYANTTGMGRAVHIDVK